MTRPHFVRRIFLSLTFVALAATISLSYTDYPALATPVKPVAATQPQVSPPWSARINVSNNPNVVSRGVGLAMNGGQAVMNFNYTSGNEVMYYAGSNDNGHSWNPPRFEDCGNDPLPAATPVRIAESPDRWVYLVWQNACDPNLPRTLGFRPRDPSGNWGAFKYLTNFNVSGASVAVGPNGVIYVSYVRIYSGTDDAQVEVIASADHGNTFSAPTQMAGRGLFTTATSITVDTASRPHVAYERGEFGNYRIYVRDFINGAWQPEVTIYGGRGFWPYLAPRSDGGIGIVFQINDNGTRIYYKRWNGQQWDGIPTDISGPNGQNIHPALTYDNSGLAYITWAQSLGSGSLNLQYSAELSSGGFNTPVQIDGDRSEFPQMASWNNNLGLAYQNDDIGKWQSYFRWIQLSQPPTNTPVATNTPTNTPTPVRPTPTATFCPGQAFTDVNCQYWAFTFIKTLNDANIVNGYTGSQCAAANVGSPCYIPRKLVTRAELMKTLSRAIGWPAITPTNQHFSDVPPSYWAYIFVERAYANGVADGLTAQQCAAAGANFPCFLPNAPLSRAQLTKFTYRARHLPPYTPTGGGQDFTDVPPSYFAYIYIEANFTLNITGGYTIAQCTAAGATAPCFLPNRNVQRDEVAKIVKRMLDQPQGTPTPIP